MRAYRIALALLLWSIPAFGNALDHLRETDDIGINKVPHDGVSKILVIPIWVGEESLPDWIADDLAEVYDPAGGPGTFRQYWLDISLGEYDPIPTVVEPVLYPDTCPIPGLSLSNCDISYNVELAIQIFGEQVVKAFFEEVLIRIRDEHGIDLSEFDVNTSDGPGQDGFFDGVIVRTNLSGGIAPPLAALNENEATVAAEPGGTGPAITMGNVALVPPDLHEFGHLLGFIDLYGGPSVNGLMEGVDASLSAFSRKQIGWGSVAQLAEQPDATLQPVLEGGVIMRVGEGPQYMLIENRGGSLHDRYDETPGGIYVYSIDEDQLPTLALGFLDLPSGGLYLPNASPPYLNVVSPVGCNLMGGGCVLGNVGDQRALVHESGQDMGVTIEVAELEPDGVIKLLFTYDDPADSDDKQPGDPIESDSQPAEPDQGGPGSAGAASTGCACSLRRRETPPLSALLLLLGLRAISTGRSKRARRAPIAHLWLVSRARESARS